MANIFRRQKVDVEALQKELQEKKEEIYRLNVFKKQILQDLNAIYLYAALSEEETKVQTLKKKQKKIMEICQNKLCSR